MQPRRHDRAEERPDAGSDERGDEDPLVPPATFDRQRQQERERALGGADRRHRTGRAPDLDGCLDADHDALDAGLDPPVANSGSENCGHEEHCGGGDRAATSHRPGR